MNLEENEIAKHIEGYEGLYLITNFGRLWSVKSKKFMKLNVLQRREYLYVNLSKQSQKKHYYIHRLVAIHFVENSNPTEYNIIDHKNGNKIDNKSENLRWCNVQLNMRNTKKQNNTSSKYKGVYLSFSKWQSEITINRVKINLGRHKTEEEAAIAYNQYIIDNNLQEFFILNKI